MAQLSLIERKKLENALDMGAGYVLDFSNSILSEFILESTGREIYDEKYANNGISKANRLQSFFTIEPNVIVGKLLSDLLDYRCSICRRAEDDACRRIAQRLTRDEAAPHLARSRKATLSGELRPYIINDSEVKSFSYDLGITVRARLFLAHASADECLREDFTRHLAVLEKRCLLCVWHLGHLHAGEDLSQRVAEEMDAADFIVVLLSASFLASPECDELISKALRREQQRAPASVLVPVVLRPCLWRETPFVAFQPLPRDGRPITTWANADEAWLEVVGAIQDLIQDKHRSKLKLATKSHSGSARTENERILHLSLLEDALMRRKRLADGDMSTVAVDQEILALKRQLRGGGQVRQGDCLGGRYSLHRRIGSGGFATVWEGEDRKLGRKVAIKVLHPNFAQDPDHRDRFFRGARIMHNLDHPSIVRVVATGGQDDGFCYYVMEYVAGGDLHRAVRERALPQKCIIPLLLQVGSALTVAHENGCVHRDVKPHNILLDSNGASKLTDFDLVRAADTAGGTRTGPMGTFFYAAPEVMTQPYSADARADVYSLAMTAVFCFFGGDLPSLVIDSKRQFIGRLPCSTPVKQVLRRALQFHPKRRFNSVNDFCTALARAAQEAVIIAPGLPNETIPIESVRRHSSYELGAGDEHVNVVAQDVCLHECDVLVMKFAQAFYGVDRQVACRLAKSPSALNLSTFSLSPGRDKLIDSNGLLGAEAVMFLGVPQLDSFGLSEIHNFARDALKRVAKKMPRAVRIAITLQGVNYLPDERLAILSFIEGLRMALRLPQFQDQGRRITIVELREARVALLHDILSNIV